MRRKARNNNKPDAPRIKNNLDNPTALDIFVGIFLVEHRANCLHGWIDHLLRDAFQNLDEERMKNKKKKNRRKKDHSDPCTKGNNEDNTCLYNRSVEGKGRKLEKLDQLLAEISLLLHIFRIAPAGLYDGGIAKSRGEREEDVLHTHVAREDLLGITEEHLSL